MKIPVGFNAQKVMITGVQRGTPWGYSLYEVQVHGSGPTGVHDDRGSNALPDEYWLGECYPNPFNPSTTIRYAVPARSRVTLEIFTILGQLVETLAMEELAGLVATVALLQLIPNR